MCIVGLDGLEDAIYACVMCTWSKSWEFSASVRLDTGERPQATADVKVDVVFPTGQGAVAELRGGGGGGDGFCVKNWSSNLWRDCLMVHCTVSVCPCLSGHLGEPSLACGVSVNPPPCHLAACSVFSWAVSWIHNILWETCNFQVGFVSFSWICLVRVWSQVVVPGSHCWVRILGVQW